MKLEWIPREQPLAAEALWAEGAAAARLRGKLLASPRAGLRLAESGDRLVVLGSSAPGGLGQPAGPDDHPGLPWVAGAIYLGRVENLYLPTLAAPTVPIAWLAARLAQLGEPPWALVPPAKALGLAGAAVVV